MADVVLVLPGRSGATSGDVEEENDEERESDTTGAEGGDGGADDRDLAEQAAAPGAMGARRGRRSGGDLDADDTDAIRPRAVSPAKGGRPAAAVAATAATATNANAGRFLAHSMVLAARSEKFAAMLRFVRRQDDDEHACADGDAASSADEGTTTNGCEDCPLVSSYGLERGDAGAPEEAAGRGLPDNGGSNGVDELPSASRCRSRAPEHCQRVHHRPVRRPRRDPTPRELELHSPLLSPRSLGLFLEFLYTGVLDPSLSTGELSELALIADEYLVPDLTRQVEALLVESLVRNVPGVCLC